MKKITSAVLAMGIITTGTALSGHEVRAEQFQRSDDPSALPALEKKTV